MSAASSFAWLAALGLVGCSLTRPSVDKCSTNADCRAAFGQGMVCGGDGLCTRAAPLDRCALTDPPDLLTAPDKYKNWLVFGSLMDRSLTTQQARERAIQLATDSVNQQDGLDGKSFGMVLCDIAATPGGLDRADAATQAALYLANDLGVPAIIGPSASTDALAVFNDVKGYGTLVISPAATSPSLSGVGVGSDAASDANPGLFWRTVPPDSYQGRAIASYLASPTSAKVAVISEAGAYGDGLVSVFQHAWTGKIVSERSFNSPQLRDQYVTEAAASSADTVLFVSSQTADAIAFVNEAAGLPGYASKTLFLTDSAANSDFLAQTSQSASVYGQILGSRVKIPDGSDYQLFSASYQAAYQDDPSQYSYVAQSYDAAWLVFYGSAWSVYQDHTLSGLGIARGLRHVSSGDSIDIVPSNWTKVTASFQAGRGIDVIGASGNLDFDPSTEETSADIEIWNISGTPADFAVVTTIAP